MTTSNSAERAAPKPTPADKTLAAIRANAGVKTALATLDAQRSSYLSQQILVATKLESARNRVDLYQALGGDDLLRSAPVQRVVAGGSR